MKPETTTLLPAHSFAARRALTTTLRRLAPLFIVVVCGSCASVPSALRQADAKMAGEDYSGAMDLYAKFADTQPDHDEAGRAHATQKVLVRLLAAEAEMSRAQRGSETARRELGERQAEADRLRAEVAKLRADLERLRNIDLQPLRQK